MQGAGTYMFRIDDERVIDATRAGSIAHLINHSCEVRIVCSCFAYAVRYSCEEFFIYIKKQNLIIPCKHSHGTNHINQ
jgi:SET domain-containing protein